MNEETKQKVRTYCQRYGLNIPQTEHDYKTVAIGMEIVGLLTKEEVESDEAEVLLG